MPHIRTVLERARYRPIATSNPNSRQTQSLKTGEDRLCLNRLVFQHPAKQGWDYGNPRYDMFNLLWLSLPQSQPKPSVTVTVTNCVTDDKGKKVCDTQ
jgi:hypothetical protein